MAMSTYLPPHSSSSGHEHSSSYVPVPVGSRETTIGPDHSHDLPPLTPPATSSEEKIQFLSKEILKMSPQQEKGIFPLNEKVHSAVVITGEVSAAILGIISNVVDWYPLVPLAVVVLAVAIMEIFHVKAQTKKDDRVQQQNQAAIARQLTMIQSTVNTLNIKSETMMHQIEEHKENLTRSETTMEALSHEIAHQSETLRKNFSIESATKAYEKEVSSGLKIISCATLIPDEYKTDAICEFFSELPDEDPVKKKMLKLAAPLPPEFTEMPPLETFPLETFPLETSPLEVEMQRKPLSSHRKQNSEGSITGSIHSKASSNVSKISDQDFRGTEMLGSGTNSTNQFTSVSQHSLPPLYFIHGSPHKTHPFSATSLPSVSESYEEYMQERIRLKDEIAKILPVDFHGFKLTLNPNTTFCLADI